ncbi:unnamed protein product [Oreochromis niloticus]|nr:unnamed protein product [Mustela putorius furo]
MWRRPLEGNNPAAGPLPPPLCKEEQEERCQSLQNDLQRVTNVLVSAGVRNRLHEGGLRARWAVVPSDGTSEVQSLTGSFGETLTLNTPDTQLFGEYGIIWSHVQGGITTVLIHYDAGEWEKNSTDKHQLDVKTGSLVILSLTANDSGRYERQLISETEGIVKAQKFDVTVVGPKPTTPPLHPTDWIIGVGVLIGLAVLLCAVLMCKYREPIKERFRVWYAPCDREDPGGSSGQENVTQDTAVQDTAVQDTAV